MMRHQKFATKALTDELLNDPRSLELQADKLLSKFQTDTNSRFLLIIDRFERLFVSRSGQEERELWQNAFVANLLHAISEQANGQVSILISLRADFYHQCAQYPELYKQMVDHQQYIGDIEEKKLNKVIFSLAQHGGWTFESGLVRQILRQMTIDKHNAPESFLPLLSHTLYETWQNREDQQLTFEGYRAAGGLKQSIGKTADTIYETQLTAEQQKLATKIFLSLIQTTSDGKHLAKQMTWNKIRKLSDNLDEVEQIIELYAKSNFIKETEKGVVLAHEAIIAYWPRLQKWLQEAQESERIRSKLTQAADDWNKNDNQNRDLFRGLELTEVKNWLDRYGQDLSEEVERFVEKSDQFVNRRNQYINGLVILGAILVLGLIIGLSLAARTANAGMADSTRQLGEFQLDSVERATRNQSIVAGIEDQASIAAKEADQTIVALNNRLTALAYTPTPSPTGLLRDQYEGENNQTPIPISFDPLCNISLWPEEDIDLFVFGGKQGATYIISTGPDGEGSKELDTSLLILDKDFSIIASNDDNGYDRWSSVEFKVTKTDFYYVEVKNLALVDSANKPFCLYLTERLPPIPTVTPTPTPTIIIYPDFFEPNDSFQEAKLLGLDDHYLVDFYPNNTAIENNDSDKDYFVFRVQSGVTYSCETTDLGSTNDTIMIVYGQDQEVVIGQNDDIAPGDSSSRVIFRSGYKGEIFVVIEPFFKPILEDAFALRYSLGCFVATITPTPPSQTPIQQATP